MDNNHFGSHSTAEDVLDGKNFAGKRILVTGVSAGLGVETVRSLVARGATVIGTARDLVKAERALAGARESAKAGGGSIELLEVDLASLNSVRAATNNLLSKGDKLDIIIANAGVMAPPFELTQDGFETQFGVNYLAHFLLVNRLASLLNTGGRVVILASSGHRGSDIDLDDPSFEKTAYDPWIAYGRSKTASILFALEFDRRHQGNGIRAVAVHPGGIATELGRHMTEEAFNAMMEAVNDANAKAGLPPFQLKSIPQGAATTVWAAVADPQVVGGQYCEDCSVAVIRDDDDLLGGVRSYARDPDRARALWAKGEEMVGEHF